MPNLFETGDLFLAVGEFLTASERKDFARITRSSLHAARSSIRRVHIPTGRHPINHLHFVTRDATFDEEDEETTRARTEFYKKLRERKLFDLYEFKTKSLTLNIHAKHYHRLSNLRYSAGSPVNKTELSPDYIPIEETLAEFRESLSNDKILSHLCNVALKCDPYRSVPFAGDPQYPHCEDCQAEHQRQRKAIFDATTAMFEKLEFPFSVSFENAFIASETIKILVKKMEEDSNRSLDFSHCHFDSSRYLEEEHLPWTKLITNFSSLSISRTTITNPVLWHSIFSGSVSEIRKRNAKRETRFANFFRRTVPLESESCIETDFPDESEDSDSPHTRSQPNMMDRLMEGVTNQVAIAPQGLSIIPFEIETGPILSTLEVLSLSFDDEFYLWPKLMTYASRYPFLKELRLRYTSHFHPIHYRPYNDFKFLFDNESFPSLEILSMSGFGSFSRWWNILAPRIISKDLQVSGSSKLKSLLLPHCAIHPVLLSLLLHRFPTIENLELTRHDTATGGPLFNSGLAVDEPQGKCLIKSFSLLADSLKDFTLRDSLKSRTVADGGAVAIAMKLLKGVQNFRVFPCFALSPSQAAFEKMTTSFESLKKLHVSVFHVCVRMEMLQVLSKNLEEIIIDLPSPKISCSYLNFHSVDEALEFPNLRSLKGTIVLNATLRESTSDVVQSFGRWLGRMPLLQETRFALKCRQGSQLIEVSIEEKEDLRKLFRQLNGKSMSFVK